MSYNCEVKEQPAQAVLSIRTRTSVRDLPQAMGQAFGTIYQYLGEMGEEPAGPPFAAYYNMDMEDLDVEIGFPIFKAVPGQGDVKVSEIPAGRFATCLYVGPYGEIEHAYNALSWWLRDNGHEPAGPVYEIYLNDAGQTPPEELQTQIMFLLK
jgi:effector-binding domain-containing protein